MEISLIIPAYNESHRLPPYLAAVREHFDDRYAGRYEVIVVDDGSQDGLGDMLLTRSAEWPELTVSRHPQNRGKGAAVQTGMLQARGELWLFADADGATPIDQEVRLREAIQSGADMAVGSRLMAGAEVTRRRTVSRGLLGRLFARVVRRWLRISVCDTQCGFKMFRREPGQRLFSLMEETGFLFDLELFVLAGRFGYKIAEVPVEWAEVPGGHLSLTRELGRTLLGLWRLRRRLLRDSSPDATA